MSGVLGGTEAIDAEELRDAACRLLADLIDRRAPYTEPPRDISGVLFASMAEQGWTLLTVPEAAGGLGQSFAALAPIYEEMGKALSPVTLFPSLASLELLTFEGASPRARELSGQIASGDLQVAVAIGSPDMVVVEGGRASGKLPLLPADIDVGYLLLLVEGVEASAWLIDLEDPGVTVSRPEMWDRSRPVIDVTLRNAAAESALAQDVAGLIERVRGHIDLALAWDSIGGARQSLDETLTYMLTRQQFGKAIGSFQALKHRAADHKVAIEIASALVRQATVAYVRHEPSAAARTGQARLSADDCYHKMAEDSVQLHGGIGFTWEHDCHLFLKRALLNETLFETPEERRDRLALRVFDRIRGAAG